MKSQIPNLSEMFGNNLILTKSQAVAVLDEVCDWESDQGELKPGKRNRSNKQIDEVIQKQKRLIAISQTSILSDITELSLPPELSWHFEIKNIANFLVIQYPNSTKATSNPG